MDDEKVRTDGPGYPLSLPHAVRAASIAMDEYYRTGGEAHQVAHLKAIRAYLFHRSYRANEPQRAAARSLLAELNEYESRAGID